jgi:2-oxoglutarate ferredoxin oxidoreductase subunit delta
LEDKVIIDPDLCTGCGVCAVMCPKKILEIDPDSGLCKVINQNECDLLGGCEFQCPTGAITIQQPAEK